MYHVILGPRYISSTMGGQQRENNLYNSQHEKLEASNDYSLFSQYSIISPLSNTDVQQSSKRSNMSWMYFWKKKYISSKIY